MPTVAVYVPADLYRRLGSSDDVVRGIARAACEASAGLALDMPADSLQTVTCDCGKTVRHEQWCRSVPRLIPEQEES